MEAFQLTAAFVFAGIVLIAIPNHQSNRERVIRYQEQNENLRQEIIRLEGYKEGAKDFR
jgi:hypothetical protein